MGGGVDGGTRFPRPRLPLRKEQYLCLRMKICRVAVEEVRDTVYCYL